MKTIKVLKVKHIKDHILHLVFSDAKEVSIDFSDFLSSAKHPDIKRYLNIKEFKTFTLQDGELMWGDFDLLFPIADLYNGQITKSSPDLKRKAS